jgi:hypothetical protein
MHKVKGRLLGVFCIMAVMGIGTTREVVGCVAP